MKTTTSTSTMAAIAAGAAQGGGYPADTPASVLRARRVAGTSKRKAVPGSFQTAGNSSSNSKREQMSDFGNELVALLPRLRRFARSLTGQQEDADDLVQGALERALRSRSLWEPGTRLDAWIFRIMRNLWIDQIRHRKLSGDRITLRDAEQLPGCDGRAVADSRITLADVEGLLASLPGEQRAVVQSVCIDDLSYRETAERLNSPIGTVMSRLARARLALVAGLDHDEAAAGVVSMTKSRRPRLPARP